MRLMSLILLALGSLVLYSGCKEVPPLIGNCETNRVVLVEEFTGVQCVNCPTGSDKLQQLSDQYGEQLVVVGIHAGFFSRPYPNSPEDFTLPAGEDIDAMLGTATLYPAASINRKRFEGEGRVIVELPNWAGYISRELCLESDVDIALTLAYDSTSRELAVTASVIPLNDAVFEDELGITVVITEDNIIAPQLTLQGEDPNYNHKHVLRDVLTDYRGRTFFTGGGQLEPYSTSFNTVFESNWKAEDCHIIAFVHKKTAGDLAVLQAVEAELDLGN